jgi:hypothetical protein
MLNSFPGTSDDAHLNDAEKPASIPVTMCRYSESGTVIKSILPIHGTEYVAVSHVWGCGLKWRNVPGIEEDVFASEEKVKFLMQHLPSIIGSKWFWMDILCINQRDEDARVAVTQHIPAIFRSAERTVVIRSGAGLRDCCVNAYKFLPDGETFDYRTVRDHHLTVHGKDIHFEEDVLSRLWPLQEILISDYIQFVRCDDVPDDEITRPYPIDGPGMMSMSSANILTDLVSLSVSWAFLSDNPTGSSVSVVEFQHAFLNATCVTRKPMNRRRIVPAGAELYIHFDSIRQTSKERDFILAIMPQYKFYTVPENAKQMTFGQLFVDCCHQLDRARPSPPPDGRVKPLLVSSSCEIFTATDNVPLPTCLGDFIKLLGGGMPIASREMVDVNLLAEAMSYHVQAQEVICNDVFETVRLIKASMNASKELWQAATSSIVTESEDQPGNYASRKNVSLQIMRIILCTLDPELDQIAAALLGDGHKENLQSRSLQDIVRFTALITCGLSASTFEWSLRNLTPLTVTFRGQKLLALAPNSVVDLKEGYEFFLRKSTRGLWTLSLEAEERWLLLARKIKVEARDEVMCLFPPRMEFT